MKAAATLILSGADSFLWKLLCEGVTCMSHLDRSRHYLNRHLANIAHEMLRIIHPADPVSIRTADKTVRCLMSYTTTLRRLRTLGSCLGLVILTLLSGCGKVDLNWSEEVQLGTGQVIVIKRAAKGQEQGELGGPGGWDSSEMTVEPEKIAGLQPFPVWRTEYVPILLDYQEPTRTWSIVATFYYCDGWYRLGRPKLPYVEYQSRNGGAWVVVPLEDRLLGVKTNLLTGPRSGGEPEFISLLDKMQRGKNAGDSFRKIVSEWKENNC